MAGNRLHRLTGQYQHHTDKALCVHIDDEDFWFPLTTVKLDPSDGPLDDYRRRDEIVFEAQEWLIIKLGLENYIAN